MDTASKEVRMTADKVITEICTMALTRLLQEAEAGKNTEKIMDTLKKMKRDPKQEKSPYDITLWESHLDTRGYQKHQRSSRTDAPSGLNQTQPATTSTGLYQKGRQSNQSGARKSSIHQQQVGGTPETAGKLPPPTTRTSKTVVSKGQYITRL